MKILPIAILLVLASCGDYKVTDSGSLVGRQVSLDTLTSFSDRDISSLNSVCVALEEKNNYLDPTSVANYQFAVTQSDCNKIERSFLADVTIDITTKTFLKTGLETFPFRDIETTKIGVLNEICPTSDPDPKPNLNGIITAGKVISVRSSDKCPRVEGEVCLSVTKASVTDGTALITSEDIIRFSVNPNKGYIGFFTYRKLTSRGISCSENQSQMIETTLQN